ncbi:hypothetical protein BDK51DRAFT_30604 [Blyttiomyces helicus]|uniref:Uncharacterized protein n=1 Tax=Blyttiomyces helicus TaxID=388810 RepID=A0A4P9WKA5_9FUNG|nr:hypothetical protein BDK51DRAFT_30604 [Blyttiomyces helicus]|eukprot:RKO91998.1 hypothetical protein BDK51DRAFT_30604 [Blyttiomyces helicus]
MTPRGEGRVGGRASKGVGSRAEKGQTFGLRRGGRPGSGLGFGPGTVRTGVAPFVTSNWNEKKAVGYREQEVHVWKVSPLWWRLDQSAPARPDFRGQKAKRTLTVARPAGRRLAPLPSAGAVFGAHVAHEEQGIWSVGRRGVETAGDRSAACQLTCASACRPPDCPHQNRVAPSFPPPSPKTFAINLTKSTPPPTIIKYPPAMSGAGKDEYGHYITSAAYGDAPAWSTSHLDLFSSIFTAPALAADEPKSAATPEVVKPKIESLKAKEVRPKGTLTKSS